MAKTNTAKKVEVSEEVIKEFMAYLPETMHKRLRLQSFTEEESMSEITRKALTAYFKKHPVE